MYKPVIYIDPRARAAVYAASPSDVEGLPWAKPVVGRSGRRGIAAPVREDTARELWKRGIAGVHPVELDYDWPGGPPFEAQRRTVSFLVAHPRAFVFNEMGTGKTKAALWALDWLRAHGRVRRALILAPLSTLRSVWMTEMAQSFLGRLSPVLLHAQTRQQRIENLCRPGWNVAVLNHDGIAVLISELERRVWDAVIVDEAAAFREARTQRSRLLFGLLHGRRPVPVIWALTGTPTPNGPVPAYGVARVVKGREAGRFTAWRSHVAVQVGPHKWEPQPDAVEKVRRLLSPAIQYRRDDMYDLPPVQVVDRQVDMTKQQDKLLKELRREGAAVTEGQRVTVAHAAALVGKALQILQGAVYGDEQGVVRVDATPRYDALAELISATDRPVLVFATFRHVLDLLQERFADVPHARMDGATNVVDRARIVDELQSGKLKVLFAHPRTMGHGLTLTAASTIVWFGPTYDYELYEQATARITRFGQKHKQFIVRILAHHIESRIYEALVSKQKMQETLLSLYAELGGHNGRTRTLEKVSQG